MARRIAAIVRLEGAPDANYAAVKEGMCMWPELGDSRPGKLEL